MIIMNVEKAVTHPVYETLKHVARKAAQRVGTQSFYNHLSREVDISHSTAQTSEVVKKCMTCLDEDELHPAHGIWHCSRVALDAGAILLAELRSNDVPHPEQQELLVSVQLAGLLHDITRNEDNHSVTGSVRAAEILNDFSIPDRHKRYITAAIRNHEAFKEVLDSEDAEAELISGALYDADKFRWGPDNFTTTLWLIVESSSTPPERLCGVFQGKMAGIREIKKTFRTGTGRTYGPEFIDGGLEIGDEIYREMCRILGR